MSTEEMLLAATGEKPRREKEKEQAYLKRLAMATDELSDPDFDTMPEDCQRWSIAAATAVNEGVAIKPPAAFDEGETPPEDLEPVGQAAPAKLQKATSGDPVGETLEPAEKGKTLLDMAEEIAQEAVRQEESSPRPKRKRRKKKSAGKNSKKKKPVGDLDGEPGDLIDLRRVILELYLKAGEVPDRETVEAAIKAAEIGWFKYGSYNTTYYHTTQFLRAASDLGVKIQAA